MLSAAVKVGALYHLMFVPVAVKAETELPTQYDVSFETNGAAV